MPMTDELCSKPVYVRNCPDCGDALTKTPGSEKWKDPSRWYNCNNCKTTWKIQKMSVFYQHMGVGGKVYVSKR